MFYPMLGQYLCRCNFWICDCGACPTGLDEKPILSRRGILCISVDSASITRLHRVIEVTNLAVTNRKKEIEQRDRSMDPARQIALDSLSATDMV